MIKERWQETIGTFGYMLNILKLRFLNNMRVPVFFFYMSLFRCTRKTKPYINPEYTAVFINTYKGLTHKWKCVHWKSMNNCVQYFFILILNFINSVWVICSIRRSIYLFFYSVFDNWCLDTAKLEYKKWYNKEV